MLTTHIGRERTPVNQDSLGTGMDYVRAWNTDGRLEEAYLKRKKNTTRFYANRSMMDVVTDTE